MKIDHLTIPELERFSYAEGFIEAANRLAMLDDCHEALAQAAIDYENLREENESLQSTIDSME